MDKTSVIQKEVDGNVLSESMSQVKLEVQKSVTGSGDHSSACSNTAKVGSSENSVATKKEKSLDLVSNVDATSAEFLNAEKNMLITINRYMAHAKNPAHHESILKVNW